MPATRLAYHFSRGFLRTNVSKLRRSLVRGGIAVPLSVAILLLLALVYPGLALQGSTFEGNDGNLVVNTAGNTDWSNAPNRVRGDDLTSGTGDNSFGQGTKEDDANVSVVTGSIPPKKSDLTRFYMVHERRDALTGAIREAVLISEEDAKRLGLADGEPVLLRNALGEYHGHVLIAPVQPGNLEIHWPEGEVLIDSRRRSPLSGIPDYNAVVSLEPATAPAAAPAPAPV